ncbi:hypothetical protein MLD38_037570 [Melastoma candidum]|uniref:Uncharacterized protein n=1 Tax=Melastoma candidum TaxID=119954 RepID=A0ACB9LN46_9MYRT|nr:hypothetical protein MLD38_040450 [Melastoma candidum]KAI4312776.1 hypothetical protein MLD38_037570 [Melastoma candidum]
MLKRAGTCNAKNIWRAQPAAVTNPFGTLPPVPKLSLDRSGTSQPIRYGISTSQVPFMFSDMDTEHPRYLIIHPLPRIRTSRSEDKQSSPLNRGSCVAGKIQDGTMEETARQRADRVAEIGALMPKLHGPDYYKEPAIEELAGYGNIRFLGDTDVRGLFLDVQVQFSHREAIVYPNKSTKPQMGGGLNKPAEVTLLNIKCLDKKTGYHYTERPRVEKDKKIL